MKLFLSVPFQTSLNIHPALLMAEELKGASYADLVSKLFETDGPCHGKAELIEEEVASASIDSLDYGDVTKDSDVISDCAYQIRLTDHGPLAPYVEKASGLGEITDMQVRVFHSGIAIACTDITIENNQTQQIEETVRQLEKHAEILSGILTRWCEDTVIKPLAQVLQTASRGKHADGTQASILLSEKGGKASWASRTLMVEASDDKKFANDMMSCWLQPFAAIRQTSTLTDPNHGYFFYWSRHALNLPVLDARGDGCALDCREALIMNCFLWAACETFEHELFRLLGRLDLTAGDLRKADIQKAHQEIQDVRSRTEYLFLIRNQMKRRFARNKRLVVQSILEGWDFDANKRTITDAIEKSRETTDALIRQRSEKGNVLTDVILLFISAVAIFDFTLNLTQFGRSLASDATLGLRDEGQVGFIQIIANLPTDLTVGGTLIAALLVLWWYYKTRNGQIF